MIISEERSDGSPQFLLVKCFFTDVLHFYYWLKYWVASICLYSIYPQGILESNLCNWKYCLRCHIVQLKININLYYMYTTGQARSLCNEPKVSIWHSRILLESINSLERLCRYQGYIFNNTVKPILRDNFLETALISGKEVYVGNWTCCQRPQDPIHCQ